MLVLTRKSTEEIKIGNDITIKVIAIRGGQVKLGIDAPRGIRVSRVERTDRPTGSAGLPRPAPPSSDEHPEDTTSST